MADPIATDWLLPLLAASFAGGLLAGFARRLAVEAGSWAACPHCTHRLPVLALMPVIGWSLARGRCGHCAAALGATTPVIELGALLVAVWAAAVLDGWLVWASCGLGWVLLALAAIDWRDLVLPDEATLPLIPAGIAVAYFVAPGLPVQHLIGAVAGFAVFVAVRWAYRRLRGREGLGLGDAKLLAAAGAWVGWAGLPSVVLIAATAALAVALVQGLAGRRVGADQTVPFGSYLALATWIVWLYGPLVFV